MKKYLTLTLLVVFLLTPVISSGQAAEQIVREVGTFMKL